VTLLLLALLMRLPADASWSADMFRKESSADMLLLPAALSSPPVTPAAGTTAAPV
jgi:hypothetical protein